MNRTPIEFNSKRKPSRALIMRTIAEYLPHGIRGFDLAWGENWIELEYYHGQWHGCGWIKEIGGDDIANELNQLSKQAVDQFYDFLHDHVEISFVK